MAAALHSGHMFSCSPGRGAPRRLSPSTAALRSIAPQEHGAAVPTPRAHEDMMCGIAGVLLLNRPRSASPDPAAAFQVRQMMAILRHRGPDGGGLYQDGPMTLGHRRLTIVDLEAGWQPMSDPSGRFTLTYNGEIYNTEQLRRDLISRGYRFKTRTDTEVLLHLFAEYGTQCLPRLNGMFAFAIWDALERRLFLARDRFGIKPLYLAKLDDRLLFASEAKALAPLLPSIQADHQALADYFTYQLTLEDNTFFKGVERMVPATSRTYDPQGNEETRHWWEIDFTVDASLTQQQASARVGRLLEDAIRLNLMGDVQVGAHLSGGIDSSSVVMMSTQVLGEALPCFSGGFHEGADFNETNWARMVADKADAPLHVCFPTADDFMRVMPELSYVLDEPIAGPGAFPQYMVSQLASHHVRVVLGGQGGDEIFGGYARYLLAYLEECLRGAIFDIQSKAPFVVTLESIVPSLPLLKPYVPLLKRFWSEGLFDPIDQRYLRLLRKFDRAPSYLSPSFLEILSSHEPGRPMFRDFNLPILGSLINKMTYVDQRHFLPALLQVEDRVSMAWSLESRVPLLDHRLVEFVARIPPTIKFKQGELKGLLKQGVRDLLPEEVLGRRDKMGFPVPLNLWAGGPLKDFFRDILLSDRVRSRGLFRPEALEHVIAEPGSFSRDLWGLLSVELWFRAFVDGDRRLLPECEAVDRIRAEEKIQVDANEKKRHG